MPPGWYDDPWAPAGLRWWDGYGWTPHTAPRGLAGTQAPLAMPQLVAGSAASQARWQPRARVGVVVGALLLGALFFVLSVAYAHLNHDLFRTADDNGTYTVTTDNSTLNFVGFIPVVIEIPFLCWLYASARLGSHLGMPAARKPLWAIFGYIVPVVSLWFPYQVARDLFPPGDPQRGLAGRWWGWTLTAELSVFPVCVVSYYSPATGLCLAALGLIATALSARAAVAMIDAATTTQQRLAGR